jgi:hypothetical protein
MEFCKMSKIETIPSVYLSEKPQTLSQITESVKELNEVLKQLGVTELQAAIEEAPFSDLPRAIIRKVIEAANAR